MNINSNQYWIPLSFKASNKKLYTQKVIPCSDKKVPVNLVVLSGLLPSWRSYTDPTSNIFSYFRISRNNFKMSSKDLLSSYINIFNAINQQMSYARLELCCKYRKVTANFSYDLRVTPRQKQLIVISWRRTSILPSLIDLREGLKPGLKRPKLKTKSSKTLLQMQILRPKKHSLILKKPHLRPNKLKIMLKKLNILLKKQRLYYKKKIWQSYRKFKLDA